MESPWIPAFAGMTRKATGNSNSKMDTSFRWNDGEVGRRHESARRLRAWVPAFAGMTLVGTPTAADGDVVHRHRGARTLPAWIPAFAGMTSGGLELSLTVMWFTAIGVPGRCGPGSKRSPG